MKFGLSFLPDSSSTTKSPVDYYKEALLLCDIAEQGNMHYIKMTEHYLHPYGGYCSSPLTFLAAVAARTKRIRLMTGCILPVFHHPLQIAADVGMLDAISEGRVDVGFARAYLPYNLKHLKLAWMRVEHVTQKLFKTVISLWTNKNVTVNSQFFSFDSANSTPPVTQQPINLPTCIAPTDNEAIKLSDRYLKKFIDVWSNAAEEWSTKTSTDYPGYKGLANLIRRNTPRVMRDSGQA